MAHGTFALSLRCTGLSFSPGRAGTAAFRFDVHVVWQRTERAVRLPVELIQRHEGFRGFASGPAECEGHVGIFESKSRDSEMFHVKTGFRCYLLCCTFKGFSHRISDVYRLLSHLTLYDVQLLSREIGGRRGHFDFHLSHNYAARTRTRRKPSDPNGFKCAAPPLSPATPG